MIFFLFLLQRGGSNEYPQSMFLIKNKKNRYTPANSSFFYIKVGFNGVYITWTCFPDVKSAICLHVCVKGRLRDSQTSPAHKPRQTFSKFYRRHYELISKFNVGLKTLLRVGLSEPEFYANLKTYFHAY